MAQLGLLLATALVALMTAWPDPAQAQTPVQIGVLTDMSGPNSDYTGAGSVEAAQMAVADFGGQVLGRKVQVISADHQNKPDVGAAIASEWLGPRDVSAIVDIPLSSVGLAVQDIARRNNKIALFSSSATSDLSGKACSPVGVQWTFDTYALTHGLADTMVKAGARKWFFITADYAGGIALEHDLSEVVTQAGGSIVGHTRHPQGVADLSAFILEAQASKADVVAIANVGQDTVNTIKQANEFGLTASGQKLAVLVMMITQVHSLGLAETQGTIFSSSFVWNRTPETRAWSERFFAQRKAMPSETQAGVYSAVLHYLKSVQAAGTLDAGKVMAQMRAMPVSDVFTSNGIVREDGLMVHDMYLVQIKSPAEMTEPWDYLKVIRTIPASDAFRPLSQSACLLVTK